MVGQTVYFISRTPRGRIERLFGAYPGVVTVVRSLGVTSVAAFVDAMAVYREGGIATAAMQVVGGDRSSRSLIVTVEPAIERFTGHTPTEFLAQAGISELAAVALLDSFGLGGLELVPCEELGPPQRRILELLAAGASVEGALLLVEPFRDIPIGWWSAVADYLLRVTVARGLCVVVLGVEDLPDVWIADRRVRALTWTESSPEQMMVELSTVTQVMPGWLAEELRMVIGGGEVVAVAERDVEYLDNALHPVLWKPDSEASPLVPQGGSQGGSDDGDLLSVPSRRFWPAIIGRCGALVHTPALRIRRCIRDLFVIPRAITSSASLASSEGRASSGLWSRIRSEKGRVIVEERGRMSLARRVLNVLGLSSRPAATPPAAIAISFGDLALRMMHGFLIVGIVGTVTFLLLAYLAT